MDTTIAGLRIATDGPFIELSFRIESHHPDDSSDGFTRLGYSIPVASISRMTLSESLADDEAVASRGGLVVDGRPMFVVRHGASDASQDVWHQPERHELFFTNDQVTSEDILAFRNALRSAYIEAGQFKRG